MSAKDRFTILILFVAIVVAGVFYFVKYYNDGQKAVAGHPREIAASPQPGLSNIAAESEANSEGRSVSEKAGVGTDGILSAESETAGQIGDVGADESSRAGKAGRVAVTNPPQGVMQADDLAAPDSGVEVTPEIVIALPDIGPIPTPRSQVVRDKDVSCLLEIDGFDSRLAPKAQRLKDLLASGTGVREYCKITKSIIDDIKSIKSRLDFVCSEDMWYGPNGEQFTKSAIMTEYNKLEERLRYNISLEPACG